MQARSIEALVLGIDSVLWAGEGFGLPSATLRVPRGLEGATFASEHAVRRAVGLLVRSLDPCVAWKLESSRA